MYTARDGVKARSVKAKAKVMIIEAKAKAKTKDLSFKAKAKADNCRPRGAFRPQATASRTPSLTQQSK